MTFAMVHQRYVHSTHTCGAHVNYTSASSSLTSSCPCAPHEQRLPQLNHRVERDGFYGDVLSGTAEAHAALSGRLEALHHEFGTTYEDDEDADDMMGDNDEVAGSQSSSSPSSSALQPRDGVNLSMNHFNQQIEHYSRR
jgi:hypothetical protein